MTVTLKLPKCKDRSVLFRTVTVEGSESIELPVNQPDVGLEVPKGAVIELADHLISGHRRLVGSGVLETWEHSPQAVEPDEAPEVKAPEVKAPEIKVPESNAK